MENAAAPSTSKKTAAATDQQRLVLRLAAFVVSCAAFVVERDRSFFLAVAAIVATAATAWAYDRSAQRHYDNTATQEKSPRRGSVGSPFRRFGHVLGGGWSLTPLLVGVALTVVGWRIMGVDGLGFMGIATTSVGASLALAAARRRVVDPMRTGVQWTAVAVLTLVAGTALLTRQRSVGLILAGLGLAATPVAVGLCTAGWQVARERALRATEGMPPTPGTDRGRVHGAWGRVWVVAARPLKAMAAWPLCAPALVGIVIVGAAALAVAGFDLVPGAATGVVLVPVVLALSFSARSNLSAILVLLVVATTWTLTHRTVTDPWEAEVGESVIVALGDSYISGEGATAFYSGTNSAGDNECRRAPTAHPVLLASSLSDAFPDELVFLACSGAKTTGGSNDLAGQVERLRALMATPDAGGRSLRPGVVLVSIGGNDALFGSIAQSCLGPGDCSVLQQAWSAQLPRVRQQLDVAYASLAGVLGQRGSSDAGVGARVVVVPYPNPIGTPPPGFACDYSLFTPDEREALGEFVATLNQTVIAAASAAGFEHVDAVEHALVGHRLCEALPSDSGVNLLALNGELGSVEESLNPAGWVHNSLHPNELGHRLIATQIDAYLDGSGAGSSDPPPTGDARAGSTGDAVASEQLDRTTCLDAVTVPPETGATDEETERNHEADRERLASCQVKWLMGQIQTFALWPGTLLVPLFFGAWLVALSAVTAWQQVMDERSAGLAV
jgi:lysophospholipase L1-like esterase